MRNKCVLLKYTPAFLSSIFVSLAPADSIYAIFIRVTRIHVERIFYANRGSGVFLIPRENGPPRFQLDFWKSIESSGTVAEK